MTGRRAPACAAWLVLAALAAAPAAADVLQLRDGRFVDGVKMRLDGEQVVLQYANGDVRVPLSLVEDFVIEGVAPWEPKSEEERAKRAEGLVPWKGKWVKPEVRDKGVQAEIAARRAELDDLKAHQEWRNRYKWETKNFLFESTLPPRIGEMYATLLETYFEDAKKSWGVRVPKDWGKLKVCLYHDKKSFNQTSGGRGGTAAYYRFVPPRELNCYYDRLDPDFAIGCALHEATHYVADLVSPEAQFPHWINESMAEYYGASDVDVAKKTVKPGGIQPGRLAEVRVDIDAGDRVVLADLIGDAAGYRAYTWGWTFVHFMMETPAYSKDFRKYFFDLVKAKDVKRERGGFGFEMVSGDETLRVFLKRFGMESLDSLQKEWYAYIDRLEATGTRGYEDAGIAAYWQGRWKFRAPRLLKAAIDGGSIQPQVYIAYSRCLRRKAVGEAEPAARATIQAEALAVIEKGLGACDPLCADLWAEKGYCLYEAERKEEGKRCVELAREMNPSEPYLEIEIREAFAGSEGD